MLSIVAVSLLGTLSQAVLPKGTIRSTLQFLCGLLLILVTIAPITKINLGDIDLALPEMPQMDAPVCDPALANQVAEECQAYVETKAHTMGYTIRATVTVNRDTPYPYPESIALCGEISESAKEKLSQIIAKDMAIPLERQTW